MTKDRPHASLFDNSLENKDCTTIHNVHKNTNTLHQNVMKKNASLNKITYKISNA